MTRLISRTFPSGKLRDYNPNPKAKAPNNLRTQVPISSSSSQGKIPNPKSWCVYLILSTNQPIKTYVGVTTDFARRFVIISSPFPFLQSNFILVDYPFRLWFEKAYPVLDRCFLLLSFSIRRFQGKDWDFLFSRLKQHNGEIRGGAKASSAGRPWLCACIINGFTCLSQG